MMHGLEFSKQAIIDFNTLKDKIATNQAVFVVKKIDAYLEL